MEKRTDMSIESFLSKVGKVKITGRNQWICQCPSHKDKSPSLALKVLDDGRILLNCFAGCDTESVLSSVGMTFDDLFPDKTHGNFKPVKSIISYREALEIIQHETRVVMLCAYDLKKNKPLLEDELKRLEKSMQMINKAINGCGL